MQESIRRGAAALVGLILTASPVLAQVDSNLSTLTGPNAEGYLSPLPTALSATLNSAIFRSGYVPESGFTFALEAKAMMVEFDDEDRTYTPEAVEGFETIEAPTIIGDETGATSDGPGGSVIDYPGGFDQEKFAFATPQFTIGAIKGTQAIFRWIVYDISESDFDDFDLWGAGLQHSISQWFGEYPVVDVAVGFMYQEFKIDEETIDASTWTVNVTGSKRFGGSVYFEPYAGLGYDSLSMTTEYENTSLSETITVDFEDQNDVHVAFGAGVGFPGVKLHAEYTIAAENAFAGGISFGI